MKNELVTLSDWVNVFGKTTVAILQCGLRGAQAGGKLGVVVGGLCGLPMWIVGSIPGALIGGVVGLVYGFCSGVLLGIFSGRWGGLIAGVLPVVLVVGCLYFMSGSTGLSALLLLALPGGLIGWRVGERLMPNGPTDPTLAHLRDSLIYTGHWAVPLWFRMVVGALFLIMLSGVGQDILGQR